MRYAQGSGLTAQGDENQVIAHDLRVSVRSVQRWLRAWSRNGPRALASKRSAPARPSPGGRSSGTRRRWPGWGKETWPSVEGPWRRSTPGPSSRMRPDSR
ncbi:helix-turn-helix domain-containing protein [Streptomyces fungicidicus]|uniref:helix-turn-helix domain-containing protein n=1 Tax=Streptomyces fungicidicus TaxID=68203 RepID=UPI00368F411B